MLQYCEGRQVDLRVVGKSIKQFLSADDNEEQTEFAG
jgi:hypothetical protein